MTIYKDNVLEGNNNCTVSCMLRLTANNEITLPKLANFTSL